MPQPEAGPGRLGLVASRKVGGAVQRNRAKRLVREAFRTLPRLFPDGVDVVVILRAGAGALGLSDVVGELRGVSALLGRRGAQARALGVAAPPGAAPRAPAPQAAAGPEASPRGDTRT